MLSLPVLFLTRHKIEGLIGTCSGDRALRGQPTLT